MNGFSIFPPSIQLVFLMIYKANNPPTVSSLSMINVSKYLQNTTTIDDADEYGFHPESIQPSLNPIKLV
jgi:hypothetical protein